MEPTGVLSEDLYQEFPESQNLPAGPVQFAYQREILSCHLRARHLHRVCVCAAQDGLEGLVAEAYPVEGSD